MNTTLFKTSIYSSNKEEECSVCDKIRLCAMLCTTQHAD